MPARVPAAAQLWPDDESLAAERLRGMTCTHRDWLFDEGARAGAARAMAALVQDIRRGDLPGHAHPGLSA